VATKSGRYTAVLEDVFKKHYSKGRDSFDFRREELETSGRKLRIKLPKNLGDIVYNYRYRRKTMPPALAATCKPSEEWIIKGVGPALYRFRKVPIVRIVPQEGRYRIKIPDATPEIVTQHALTDEQALLAKIRYNRLIDIFTGLVTYSLQNHLRTQIEGVQIEVDELYVGVKSTGAQYVLPVQAKGTRERLGRVQLEQDLDFCRERFPHLTTRAIGAQFLDGGDAIAMFELTVVDDRLRILEERHYVLVPASEIETADLERMSHLT